MGGLKLGKHDVVQAHIDRAIKFSDYVPAVLPVIPGSFDNLGNVYAGIGVSDVATLFPLDGNDTLGDCVMCAVAHGTTVYGGLAGRKNIPAQGDVETLYTKLSGGDNGLNVSSTLDYWIKNGAFGEKPVAKAYIDPANWDHMRLAIYMFGGLMAGIQCTDAMQANFQSGTPWDGSGTVEGGHGIFLPSFAADGSVEVLTWGGVIKALPSAIALMDECWIVVSAEQMANPQKFSDLGFNAEQFLADAQAIADQY